jgi:hypothetical protein
MRARPLLSGALLLLTILPPAQVGDTLDQSTPGPKDKPTPWMS